MLCSNPQKIHDSIYIYMIQVRGSTASPSPPMVWVPRTRPLDPDSRAICSISELQLPICTLFAPLQSPNPPICALYAPLRSPNFSTYNLYGLFTSLQTVYMYIYIYIYIHARHMHHFGAPTSLHIFYMDYLHHYRQYTCMYIYTYVCLSVYLSI